MVLTFFTWCEQSAVGASIRNSTWLCPAIEAAHLLALGVLGGVVLIVNLRLLNLGLWDEPVAHVTGHVRRIFRYSLAAMLVTGLLLFASEATKCYSNGAFWWKMVFLAAALIFTFGVSNRVLRGHAADNRWTRTTIAIVSLTLWTGVGVMGRGIGFY
jgi:hypothetical protein